MDFQISDYSDDRFKKIKIWIAHTGENLNNTVFELEALQRMSDTLSYTPIVGYVDKNSEGDDDFSDHRQRIILDRDGIKVEYMGVPWGLIPENHNAKIEYREGKEWLTAEGLLWTKFEKGLEILEKSNGRKSQSMEIDGIDGFVDDEGRLNIQQARFSGLCILGDEVAPAMVGSTIEYFSTKGLKEEMKTMLEELSYATKGADENLDNELNKDNENVAEDKGVKDDDTKDLTKEGESSEPEATKENDGKDTEGAEKPKEDPKEEPEVATNEDPEDPEKPEGVAEGEPVKAENVEPSAANAEPQTLNEDVPAPTPVPTPTTTQAPTLEPTVDADYVAKIEKELVELRAFVAEVKRKDKEAVIEDFKDSLTKEDLTAYKAKIDEYDSTESLERDIVFSIFKSKKESPAKEESPVSLATYSLESKQGNAQFGELEKYFN